MKKLLFILPLVVLVAAACNSNSNNNNSNVPAASQPQNTATPPTGTNQSSGSSGSTTSTGAVKKFTVTGMNYSFSPKTITVNKGDKVQITFENNGGTHNFVVPEFNAATPIINTGQTAIISFTASKAGTFEFYCSVDGHRMLGMTGNLIVK